jgi:hypothetical protein
VLSVVLALVMTWLITRSMSTLADAGVSPVERLSNRRPVPSLAGNG